MGDSSALSRLTRRTSIQDCARHTRGSQGRRNGSVRTAIVSAGSARALRRKAQRDAAVCERGGVNVNTTDATAGATALLLPAQNTYTLHDPKRDT
jgi:hypothetical protein